MKVFIIAGEASGDVLGARLMTALKAKDREVVFSGVGGAEMKSQGLKSLFPMEDLSVMGAMEVLPRLPKILFRLSQTVAAVLKENPDVVVTIDSPDFCFRVLRKLKKKAKHIPCVHYVAPSVWAWRPGRAKYVAGFLDHLLALLPFEPPFFEKEGLACTFVGHPIVEGRPAGDAEAFRRRHVIAADRPVVTLLPGSRRGEIERMAPIFRQTMEQLAKTFPGLVLAIPTLPHLRPRLEEIFQGTELNTFFLCGESEKRDALAASRGALAASGTVTLELAAARVPHVIGYRLNTFSAFLARRLIKTPFVNLVNIVLNKEVVPEFLLENCSPEKILPEIKLLLEEEQRCLAQRSAFQACLKALGEGGALSPSQKVADVVFALAREQKRKAA